MSCHTPTFSRSLRLSMWASKHFPKMWLRWWRWNHARLVRTEIGEPGADGVREIRMSWTKAGLRKFGRAIDSMEIR